MLGLVEPLWREGSHVTSVSGKKVDLVARLEALDENETSAEESFDVESEKSKVESLDEKAVSVEESHEMESKKPIEHATTEAVHQASTSTTNWSKLTVPVLKKELELRGLPVSGKKADLVVRLETSESLSVPPAVKTVVVVDSKPLPKRKPKSQAKSKTNAVTSGSLTKMTVAQLKAELKSKGLKVGGKKQELIERLEASTK